MRYHHANGFTIEEAQLVSLYTFSSQKDFVAQLTAALPFIPEPDMQDLVHGVILKVDSMTDAAFADFCGTLETPDYSDIPEHPSL